MRLPVHTASLPGGHWAVELQLHTSSLPGGSGQQNSCCTPPHCLWALPGAWCGVVWRGVVCRGVALRGVAWRGAVCHGVAWRGVVWCGAVRQCASVQAWVWAYMRIACLTSMPLGAWHWGHGCGDTSQHWANT